MSYSYQTERHSIFTETGSAMLLEIRDKSRHLLETAGAVEMSRLLVAGDSWTVLASLACVDYLVERGELHEVTAGQNVAEQHRVFVRGHRWRTEP